jgi:hypothetical protein
MIIAGREVLNRILTLSATRPKTIERAILSPILSRVENLNRIRPKLIAAAAAFLMFEGELMAGKRLLPDFGGSAYVWYSVVLFFQLLVVAGYYGSRRLGQLPEGGRNLILAGLGFSSLLTLLRSLPCAFWLPAELQPMVALIPFAGAGAALFCVTPLLHRNQADAADYSIFAWSNAGALVGLMVYPFLVEPLAGLVLQNWVWAAGVLLISTVGLRSANTSRTGAPEMVKKIETGMGRTRWEWWVLPAVSSATLLATTNQLSYEASPGPLAWALVLALFLASYVWAFSKNRQSSVGLIAVAGLVAITATHLMVSPRSLLLVALILAGGGASMTACHVWLAATKNENSHGFYSATAIGGAIGSAVMVLVVPHVTDGPVEFPILVLGTLSIGGFRWSGRIIRPILATVAVVAIGGTIAAESSGREEEVARIRTLYGCLRVTKSRDGELYRLINNMTYHGEEDRQHPERGWTYYGKDSAIGQLILGKEAAMDKIKVGVVGLGAGTINRLLRAQDSITYYEINPVDEELARKYFSYLKQPLTSVVIGDGRKSLEQETDLNLDVLVVDAFHGDAIPIHLLTREAGMIYRRHLKKDGALAVHITNAHVDLLPVVKGLARSLGMTVEFHETEVSSWAILKPGAGGVDGKIIEWTDDRSSILAVLKPYHPAAAIR